MHHKLVRKTHPTTYNGRDQGGEEDIETAAELALPHRVRRQPLQDIVVDVDEVRRRRQA